MVVRSVVRRGRLRELGVSKATFRAAGEPVPVGATVQILYGKKIKVSVTFENTGPLSVSGDFTIHAFYADTLSDSSGDPQSDEQTWFLECDDWDSALATLTLEPGSSATLEGEHPVDTSTWAEPVEALGSIKLDAGITLKVDIGGTTYYLDSLKIADAVEIVKPPPSAEITDVTFSEV
mgnify:CR=1 FL=1